MKFLTTSFIAYCLIAGILTFFLGSCSASLKEKKEHSKTDTNKESLPPALPRFIKQLKSADTLGQNTDTLVFFKRSACFGFCPTYHYTLFQNGVVRYHGLQHTEPLGVHYALITDQEWLAFKSAFDSARFSTLLDVYPELRENYIPDLPNTLIILKEYGIRKQVLDNHSCPKALKQLEFFLEERIKTFHFQKVWND